MRFVDDIFILHNLTNRGLDNLVKTLNLIHTKIQFTLEVENQGQLPFLDVLVEHKQNVFQFDIYRKPTFCLRYVDGLSAHPISQKLAFIHSSIQRIFCFQLDEEKTVKELNFLRKCCVQNHLNPNNVDKIFRKIKKKLDLLKVTSLVGIAKTEKKFMSLPFNNVNLIIAQKV